MAAPHRAHASHPAVSLLFPPVPVSSHRSGGCSQENVSPFLSLTDSILVAGGGRPPSPPPAASGAPLRALSSRLWRGAPTGAARTSASSRESSRANRARSGRACAPPRTSEPGLPRSPRSSRGAASGRPGRTSPTLRGVRGSPSSRLPFGTLPARSSHASGRRSDILCLLEAVVGKPAKPHVAPFAVLVRQNRARASLRVRDGLDPVPLPILRQHRSGHEA